MFAWAVAAVLVLSFAALAALWQQPRLADERRRALLRFPRALEPICTAIGLLLFAGLVYCGFAGTQVSTDNALPTFVYVLFWVGLVPASALLGDTRSTRRPCGSLAGCSSTPSARRSRTSARRSPTNSAAAASSGAASSTSRSSPP